MSFVWFLFSGIGPALLLGWLAFVRWRRNKRARLWREGKIKGKQPIP